MGDLFLPEHLEVDLSVFDLVRGEEDEFELTSSLSSSRSEEEIKRVKSRSTSNSKVGAKLSRQRKAVIKPHSPSVASLFEMLLELDFNVYQRRNPNVLPFPHTNDCNSMRLFPTAYSKLMSSGDISSLSSLILAHFDEHCFINYQFLSPNPLTPKQLVKLLEVVTELRPDVVMRVSSVEKAAANQINATIAVKCTDSKALFDAQVSRTKNQPLVPRFLQMCREDDLKQRIVRSAWPAENKHQLAELVDAGVAFEKQVEVKMVFTVDPSTGKVVEMTLMGRIMSLEVVVPDELW